ADAGAIAVSGLALRRLLRGFVFRAEVVRAADADDPATVGVGFAERVDERCVLVVGDLGLPGEGVPGGGDAVGRFLIYRVVVGRQPVPPGWHVGPEGIDSDGPAGHRLRFLA